MFRLSLNRYSSAASNASAVGRGVISADALFAPIRQLGSKSFPIVAAGLADSTTPYEEPPSIVATP